MSCCLAVLLALAPQGTDHAAGVVVDRRGEPVAGAVVTFLSRPIPRSLDAGPEDRRSARTDERGRFRQRLDAEARYTVWAGWPDAASALVEGYQAGEFLELRQAPGSGPVTLRVVGLDAWPEAAALTLRALVGGENLDFVTLSRDGDAFRVPALPPNDYRAIEVLDGRGEVLWADTMRRAADGGELALAPPDAYTVTVADADGAPLAGVTIRWHIRNYWYSESAALPYGDRFRSLWPVVGTTGADGTAALRLPVPDGERDVWLLAQKDGYAMSLDGIDDGHRFRDGQRAGGEPVPRDQPIRITLRRCDPVAVPLTGADRMPFADEWLFLIARVHVQHDRGASGTPLTLTLPVKDGAGRFASALPPGTEIELAEFRLSQAATAALVERHGMSPWPVWRLPEPERLLAAGGARAPEPGALRVLRVTAADGRPAARSVVFVEGSALAPQWRTDRLGRVLVPSDHALRIAAFGEHGYGVVRVEPGTSPIELPLGATVTLPVRVVDAGGDPAAGVRVSVQQLLADDPDLAGDAECANTLLGLWPPAPSDADGKVALILPPFPCTVQLHADRRTAGGTELAFDPAAPEPHVLTVEGLAPGR